MPATVTVKNIGDSPISSSGVPVTKGSPITVTAATFSGTVLHVAASSTAAGALTVSGYDPKVATLGTDGTIDITTGAPPATVTVTNNIDKASAPVQIIGGGVTPPGEPPLPPGPVVAPQCTISSPTGGADTTGPCPDGAPPAGTTPTVTVATPAATALGDSVTLDASGTLNATSYKWTYVSGPAVTITNETTAKPTVKLTPYDVTKYTTATLPRSAQSAPVVLQVVATNGAGTPPTSSAPTPVTIPVKIDTAAVTATKFTAGKEYRVDGTSVITGGSLVLNPPTTVAIYNTTTGALVGTAQVDTTGVWSYRPRSPFAATQIFASKLTVVTSRGGFTTGTVAGAPN
jgi:hypothetical protein